MTTLDPGRIADRLEELRRKRPLVHNITNYVVMNSSANTLLALGASPAMVHDAAEVEEFAALSDALVVNIGTLSPGWVAGMKLAARTMDRHRKPWVLDPVGVGATRLRRTAVADLLEVHPTVVRGNASEIVTLAGLSPESQKGVDATDAPERGADAAETLARSTGRVVAATGATDRVASTDARADLAVGHPMMTRITGTGCAVSAVIAAFLAVEPDPFHAAIAGLTCFGIAGEVAAARARGPGSFQVELYDALAALDRAQLTRRLTP